MLLEFKDIALYYSRYFRLCFILFILETKSKCKKYKHNEINSRNKGFDYYLM